MRVLLVLVAVPFWGCGATPYTGPAWSGAECSVRVQSAPWPRLDLLFAISNAPSMASRRSALLTRLRRIGDELAQLAQRGRAPWLHVAVAGRVGFLDVNPFAPRRG
jgi:hypothetical protein